MGIKYELLLTLRGGQDVLVAVEWWGVSDEEAQLDKLGREHDEGVITTLGDGLPTLSIGTVWPFPSKGEPSSDEYAALRAQVLEDFETHGRVVAKAVRALLADMTRRREREY